MTTLLSMQRPWLVTGAAGFVGAHVVQHLLEAGAAVVGVDSLAWGRLSQLERFANHRLFHFSKADVREPGATLDLLSQYRPECVIHLAALHYIPAAAADPALTIGINVYGTQVLLSAAAKAEVKCFWYASTGDVYAPSQRPHREDEQPGPFNIYGLSKLQGEQLVEAAARTSPDTHFVVGRMFNLYGPGETNPHFLPEILRQLRENNGSPLRLGNLWPRRDLTPVKDAARAIVETARCASPGVTTLNIASGVTWSIREIVDLVSELLGRPVIVESDPCRVRPSERPHLQADVTRLRALIGWTPYGDIRRGLSELLAAEGLIR